MLWLDKMGVKKGATVILTVLILTACGSTDQEPTGTTESASEPPSAAITPGESTGDTGAIPRPPNAIGTAPTAEPAPDSSFDADGDGWLSWEEVTQGVNTEFPKYEWPESYTTSAEAILDNRAAPIAGRLDDTDFEAGTEVSLPGEAHFCAWAYNWLDGFQANDEGKMDDSMQQITSHTLDLPSMTSIRNDLEAALNKAQLGDPSDLKMFTGFLCDPGLFGSTLSPIWRQV